MYSGVVFLLLLLYYHLTIVALIVVIYPATPNYGFAVNYLT